VRVSAVLFGAIFVASLVVLCGTPGARTTPPAAWAGGELCPSGGRTD
jgi:hypothetical protein